MTAKLLPFLLFLLLAAASCHTDTTSEKLDCCAKNKSSHSEKDIKLANVLQSTITCPHCQFQKEENMPTEVCLGVYECTKCAKNIISKEGDCCVYCSHGSVKCPSKQGKN